MEIKQCSDFSGFGQTASTKLWVITAAEAFYVSHFTSQWKATCFYKLSPLRNTCTEQRAHCFSPSYIVKDWKTSETTPGRFAESLILLAPLGWLKSSCQKHSITTDEGLWITELVTLFLLDCFPFQVAETIFERLRVKFKTLGCLFPQFQYLRKVKQIFMSLVLWLNKHL